MALWRMLHFLELIAQAIMQRLGGVVFFFRNDCITAVAAFDCFMLLS